MAQVGLKWEDFVITDNACPDAPPLRVRGCAHTPAARAGQGTLHEQR